MFYASHWLVWNEELRRWCILLYIEEGPGVVSRHRFKWLACLRLAWIIYREDIFHERPVYWSKGSTAPSTKVLITADSVSKHINDVLNQRSQ